MYSSIILDLGTRWRRVTKTDSVALTPQGKYTDSTTAAGRRILKPSFADMGYAMVSTAVPTRPLFSILWNGADTFFQNSSSFIVTRLSGPRSRPATTLKIW
jgi:hypothetical protein